jgi:hypothetical protein
MTATCQCLCGSIDVKVLTNRQEGSEPCWCMSARPCRVGAYRLTVKYCNDGNLYAAVKPALDIFCTSFDVSHTMLPRASAVRLHDLRTMPHEGFVFGVQEVCGLVVLWHQEYASHSIGYGNDALNDVQPGKVSTRSWQWRRKSITPSPAWIACCTVHIQDRPG